MSRRLLQLLAGLLLTAALVGGILAGRWLNAPSAAAPALDGTLAFADLDGKPHRLAEWQGKTLIVNFWASWCTPCVEEMPEFAALQSELADSNVQFIGILLEDDSDDAREFLRSHPVNYPILNGNIGGQALAAQLGNRSGVLPFSVIYRRDGSFAYHHAGRFSRAAILAQLAALR